MPDYLQLYEQEKYLFDTVNHSFITNHYLTAFDFFLIVIWKSNRSKSYIANLLIENGNQQRMDLELIVKDLTINIYNATDDKERMRILIEDWKFRLPMASAILTVLYPNNFTIYDTRVCGQLNNFANLINWTNFNHIYEGYVSFKQAVIVTTPENLSLRDKDRYLFGKSISEQLLTDIQNQFQRLA